MRGSGELGGMSEAVCFLIDLLIADAFFPLLPFVAADAGAAFALDLVTRFAFCSPRNCVKKVEESSPGGR